ncbi:MAG: DUF1697 domain-containing protein [Roseiarcus sp.]
MTRTFVALLRGVNVGGANRLPIAALESIVASAGASHVETFIQSGNVVFEAAADQGEAIAAGAQREIERIFGFFAPIVVRDAERWRALAAGNPFVAAGADPAHLHASCLSAAPSALALAQLDPKRSPPDEFVVVGSEIYLRLPNGVARSKLTNAWFDSRLGVVSTMRNWRTVMRLAAMIEARRG